MDLVIGGVLILAGVVVILITMRQIRDEVIDLELFSDWLPYELGKHENAAAYWAVVVIQSAMAIAAIVFGISKL